MNILSTNQLTGLNAPELGMHICLCLCRCFHQSYTKHHLMIKLTGILVQNYLLCSCWFPACREERPVCFTCQQESRLNKVARPLLFETLSWLLSHLSGAFYLWSICAGRVYFISEEVLADATNLFQLSHAGTHSVYKLTAFPSLFLLLIQHYLHASTAKLSCMILQIQAKTRSFSNTTEELSGEKWLEMSEVKGVVLAFLEKKKNWKQARYSSSLEAIFLPQTPIYKIK